MDLYVEYVPNILKGVHFYLTILGNSLKKVYILSFRVIFRHVVRRDIKFKNNLFMINK
jgi:hypothetical protein